MKYCLIVDTTDCVGCHACEVACKQEQNLPVGLGWIRVSTGRVEQTMSKQQLRYTVTHCLHCKQPPCSEVCPTKAITRRGDGIVIIKEDACTGCKDCIQSCASGVIRFNEEKGLAQKCDMCLDRLKHRLEPACVAACPSHCIYFGDITEVNAKLKAKKLLMRHNPQ